MANIKGHEIKIVLAKDSFGRRAVQYQNKIMATLKRIGLSEDYIDLPMEKIPIKLSSASITWYIDGNQLHFSYRAAGKFVDNLFVVSKILELEVDGILSGRETMNDFIAKFSEEGDIAKERKEARLTLGLDTDTNDKKIIDQRYKALAKECHPDTANADSERFKAINRAHKILKRELA